MRLFEQAPDVLATYQAKWRYLHVDEYQDTNRAQYLWIRQLAARHHNLAVVGDDDQSIYSWRGADLRNILDFERDYPKATVVKLEQNYRSTQLILDAAHAVVSRNEGRKDKKLWTENDRGVRIERFEADREDEEAEWIARQIDALVQGRGAGGSILARRADEGDDRLYRLKDIAVMYRTNAQSRAIEESCLRYGLRYQLVGGTRFYQRREVKDALAYLRTLRNDRDVAAFERILNVPARGIGDKTLEHLRAVAAANEGDVWTAILLTIDDQEVASRTRHALTGFAELVTRLRRRVGLLALPELLDAVLEESGYRAMLHDGSEEGQERWDNLLELREVVGALRRPGARGRPRPTARGDRPGRRPGRLRRLGRPGHAHHPPRRQGPRVRRRLHRRPRGGRLPAQPRARRSAPDGGGASARLRRPDPRAPSAVPDPRRAARDVGPRRLLRARAASCSRSRPS